MTQARKQLDTFAARLKALRLQAGLSVTALAIAASIERTYLHALEAGRKAPSLEIACRLADALHVPLDVFRPA